MTPEQAKQFLEFLRTDVREALHGAMLVAYAANPEVSIDLRDEHGPSEYIVSDPDDWWFNGFSTREAAQAWCDSVGLRVKMPDPVAALDDAWKGDGRKAPEDGED